jgi:hypothetical protein
MVPFPGHWAGGDWLVRPDRGVATFAGLAHARGARSLARLGHALRLDQLNRPKGSVATEQFCSAEAGVTLAAVGVEELERGSPARRAGPVAGDEDLRSLPDDVTAEPDPRSTGQLQPDAGRLPDRALQATRAARASRPA